MKEVSIKITDPIWMHPGTATLFTNKMQEFSSVITVTRGKDSGNGKEFFGVMKLKNLKGAITTIRAEGPDEDRAIKAVQKFFSENETV
jgi:phosphotransferase system HPr (HPr) family protein